MYWPASHAIVTCYPLNGFHHKPPLCKGRWHFPGKMTEGLLLTSLSSFSSLPSISQSLSLSFARQLSLRLGHRTALALLTQFTTVLPLRYPSPTGEGFQDLLRAFDDPFFRRGGVSPPVFTLQSNVFGRGDPSPTVSIGRGRREGDPKHI